MFVETVGGDLTVKVENNTETGEGIYREPVDEPLQSLADAEVALRPGRRADPAARPAVQGGAGGYLVFDTRTSDVVRLDGIGQALPAAARGPRASSSPAATTWPPAAVKTFDTDTGPAGVRAVVRSTNGEDVLYVFHAARPTAGTSCCRTT